MNDGPSVVATQVGCSIKLTTNKHPASITKHPAERITSQAPIRDKRLAVDMVKVELVVQCCISRSSAAVRRTKKNIKMSLPRIFQRIDLLSFCNVLNPE